MLESTIKKEMTLPSDYLGNYMWLELLRFSTPTSIVTCARVDW